MGARPQKLAFSEVYQALQTGVVEAQENSWTSMYTMKFFEVQPHIIETNHGMMSFMVTVSSRWWEGLPGDIRDGLGRALSEASREANASAEKMHQDNKNRIIASGRSEIIVLTEDERKAWHKAMQPV